MRIHSPRKVWRAQASLVTALLAATLLAGACTAVPTRDHDAPARSAGSARTLVLYDSTGPYAALGELYAIQAANLVSRFGTWNAHPVGRYTAGEAGRYSAVVYVGSTYDEPLPAAFLADVAAGDVKVLWLNNNIWQLTTRHPQLTASAGIAWQEFDRAAVAEVRYKGSSLTRDTRNEAGIGRLRVTDPAKAKTVAEAVRADGSTFPWGVRSGNLTYLGEVPFSYVTSGDRYLAFADLLYDLLAPETETRHRALVRIEDVGPQSDPAQLRAIADYLHGRGVPFSVAVYVDHHDPAGVNTGGKPVRQRLSESPEVVAALKYMTARGGTLIMHGYTHGYAPHKNPYGASGDDFEFYRAHIGPGDVVVLDGPVSGDSAEWARGRVAAARREWEAAGLRPPEIFEIPHYVASATDYRAISSQFKARYERGLYFPGVLTGGRVDHNRSASQFFPYPVRDVYGAPVIPETLGNVAVEKSNQHGVRLPPEMLEAAKRQLVVRDGFASFFYHPFLGLQHLPALVEGLQKQGYTFVSAQEAVLQ